MEHIREKKKKPNRENGKSLAVFHFQAATADDSRVEAVCVEDT